MSNKAKPNFKTKEPNARNKTNREEYAGEVELKQTQRKSKGQNNQQIR